MGTRSVKLTAAAATCLVFFLAFYNIKRNNHYSSDFSDEAFSFEQAQLASLKQESFVSHEGLENFIHAPTVTEMANKSLRAVWYGGSRDGAADTKLYTSTFNLNKPTWSQAKVLLTREQAEQELNVSIKKLSNPVVWTDNQGTVWLFYVSVRVGGLMFSSLNVKKSKDHGSTWTQSERIFSSPFLNYSTLVKSKPFHTSDGSIVLPIYHQFASKLSELLILNQNGKILDKKRLSKGRESIQPEIIPTSKQKALVVMRDANDQVPNKMVIARSNKGADSWSNVEFSQILNPNSAVTAVKTASEQVILAYNNQTQGRTNLSLALSNDMTGKNWQVVDAIEQNQKGYYAYPYMIRDSKGSYHLLYTWNKTRIKHVQFNDAWLGQQVKLSEIKG